MERRLYFMRNNKGFSLVELIVVIIVLGIVMAAISSFLRLGYVMNAEGNELYEVQSRNRIALGQIVKEVRFATEIYITDAAVAISEKSATMYSYVYYNDGSMVVSIYDESSGSRTDTLIAGPFDPDETYFAKVSGEQGSLYFVLSSIVDDSTYSIDTTIILPNLDLVAPTAAVQGASTGSAVKFKVKLIE